MRRILYRVFLFINGNRIKCILFSIVVFLYTVGVSFILMFHSTALKYQDLVEEIYPALELSRNVQSKKTQNLK